MKSFFLYKPDRDLEYRVFEHNRLVVFVISLLVVIANVLFLVGDTVMGNIFNLHQGLSYLVTVALIVYSGYIAILSYPKKKQYSLWMLRADMIVYILLIALEALVLTISRNDRLAAVGGSYAGVSIAFLYLCTYVFMPFVRPLDCLFVNVVTLAATVIPALSVGNEAYNLPNHLIIALCLISACYVYRMVILKMTRSAISLRRERQRYKALTRQSLETVARAIDARDPYLKGHSHRVALFARELGKRMGLREEEQEELYFVGLLHDIGKIGTPDGILQKVDRLNDTEYDTMRKHTIIGYEIIKGMTDMKPIAEAVLHHHEHFDGTGYPDGLKGDELSLYSRIICVADSYDAMSSARAYRSAMPLEFVLKEFERCRGTQFDPNIVDILLEMQEGETPFHPVA